jgi:hypothetical protein
MIKKMSFCAHNPSTSLALIFFRHYPQSVTACEDVLVTDDVWKEEDEENGLT